MTKPKPRAEGDSVPMAPVGNGFARQAGELETPPWWCGCDVHGLGCATCAHERIRFLACLDKKPAQKRRSAS